MEWIKAKDSVGREIMIRGRWVTVTDVEQSSVSRRNVLVHHRGGTFECWSDYEFQAFEETE